MPSSSSLSSSREGEWINNLNKTAILKAKKKMRADPSAGKGVKINIEAEWKAGVVTGVDGKMVCYAPPSIQLGEKTQGPSVDSYCPLVAAGCFSIVMMMDAAEKGMQFDALTSQMIAKADMIGFYKKGWQGSVTKGGFFVHHPWGDGIKLGIIVNTSEYTQSQVVESADHSSKHCPSSEIMKRSFPAEIDSVKVNRSPGETENAKALDWDHIPVYYDMHRYKEIGEMDKYMVQQEANMTWHCQNENTKHPDSLMSFQFPHDSQSSLILSFDKPIASGKYANPVQACFFGGLSSLMHTVACRIYARGYKIHSIKGAIRTEVNKRKVMAVETTGWVFPQGALIDMDIVSNVPQKDMDEILYEVDNMSPTMMNWRNELPFLYGVALQDPTEKQKKLKAKYVKGSVVKKEAPPEQAPVKRNCTASSTLSVNSSDAESVGSDSTRSGRFKNFGLLNFFWKLAK